MEFISNVEDVKRTIIENTEFIKSLENCCDDSFHSQIQKMISETLKERLELGERLIAMKAKQKRIDAVLQQGLAETDIVEDLNKQCLQSFEKEDKKRINVKITSEYKQFKRELEAVNADSGATNTEDEDVAEVMQPGVMVVSMHDPWSKALMLNAVRNINCGHHYEHDSVQAIIKDNMGIRCPVVGCASKSYIQPHHLEPDMALRAKIRAYKAELEFAETLSDGEN
ncbi:E3 SUMO-protein ligase NSE2 [Drosophila virilis]|uniref:E3 SUMO-protein ligase NSE2 n=1 Tax=Drosophila virilis TaxID=7244 RepID=B4M3K8_DROVI|nr:uncharacterized protein LOC6631774 [Drosophila virilis]EDW65383.1 uncharacterized protein Dvir_GJ19226 [Drosophila virilis]